MDTREELAKASGYVERLAYLAGEGVAAEDREIAEATFAFASAAFDRLMTLDCRRCEAELAGKGGRVSEGDIGAVLDAWVRAVSPLRRLAGEMEGEQASRLSSRIKEADAMLAPALHLGDGEASRLRDEALADHRAGRTVPLLEGLPR